MDLICQYVMISINFAPLVSNVFDIPLCNILYIILILKDSFQNLIIKYKFIVLIVNIKIDLN